MSTNLSQLQSLVQQPAARAFFKGLFARARLELTDTGERFTIHQEGDDVRVAEGFDGPDANLVVPLASQNLANLGAIFADRQVTGDESYRIVRFMLRPCLEASLQMPILQNDRLLRILGVDDWQQALLDPQGREDVQLTVHKTDGQWTVSEGYHGNPRRRLRLTAEQMLDFQRRLFKADEENSISGWMSLAGWYVTWRDQLTVPVGS
ncbi:MAG: hypothetical protein IPJ58_18015 [Ardenticatenia bacterium]|nr:hypothetical protein [Ardenticatenia bacterium]HRA19403.1 hypothetical protein [Anaerolineae bacterium]